MKLCHFSAFGNLLVALGIVKLVKDLEQDVDGPTMEKYIVVETLCVVGAPICTVQYEPVLWG